jgi:hypothetical protein
MDKIDLRLAHITNLKGCNPGCAERGKACGISGQLCPGSNHIEKDVIVIPYLGDCDPSGRCDGCQSIEGTLKLGCGGIVRDCGCCVPAIAEPPSPTCGALINGPNGGSKRKPKGIIDLLPGIGWDSCIFYQIDLNLCLVPKMKAGVTDLSGSCK